MTAECGGDEFGSLRRGRSVKREGAAPTGIQDGDRAQPSASFPAPGGRQRSDGEQQGGKSRRERDLAQSGDDVVAIGAQAEPISSGRFTVGRGAANIG